MEMELIHLIICHLFCDILECLHGNRLTGYIEHEPSYLVLRVIFRDTLRHCTVIQLCDLKDGTCRPVSACCILRADCHILSDIHDISFFAESVRLIADEIDITSLRSISLLHCHGCSQLCLIIFCQSLCRISKL